MSGGTAEAATPKKKLPLVKLAIFLAVPLLLAGGGYAGWTMFLAAPGEEHAAEGEHGEGAPDALHVSAIDYSIAAETSYTYTLALSVMLKDMCGATRTTALEAEADKEMQSDGKLVHLSWEAAYRRLGTLGVSSCDYMVSEIMDADGKARDSQLAAAEAAKKAEGGH